MESIEDVAIRSLLLERMNQVLKTLSAEEQELICELFYKEQTERETCEKLGIAKTTLHRRKQRTLAKLKTFLEK